MNFVLQRIIEEMDCKGVSQKEVTQYLRISESSFGGWKAGRNTSYLKYLHAIADFLNVSVEYLRGETDDKRPKHYGTALTVSEDYTTFPVIGEVAAGYGHVAAEDWDGETVDIPNSYLKGHDKSEFMVLKIMGDSMLPKYENGDKVLIKRQSSLDHSGQIGVVLYDGDIGTFKKVEYVQGEDWMELIPLNPLFSRIKIEGPALEQCKVLGVPKLLIREIDE